MHKHNLTLFLKKNNFFKFTLVSTNIVLFNNLKKIFNAKTLNNVNKEFLKKVLTKNPKVKNDRILLKNTRKAFFIFLNNYNKKKKINKSDLIKNLYNFSLNKKSKKDSFFFKKIFDIYFLRKEKIYTKLKYSRVPQYDIVSGASAALLAGFLGFLITEKYGFELIDSGDFYVLFMYLVFLSFSLRLFVRIISLNPNNWSVISLKWFFYYFNSIFVFIKFFKTVK